MANQETNKTKLRLIVEAVFGTTPATGWWQELRVTGQGLRHKKDTVVSNEIQSSRMVVDVFQVGQSAEGDLQFELSYGSYDRLIEGALASTFGTGTTFALSGFALEAVAATDKFVRVSGSWITDGFVVNQWIKAAGFSNGANNGYHKVTAVTALELTCGASSLVDEASAAGRTITGVQGPVCSLVSLEAVAATDKFVRAAGSWITDGFVVGMWIRSGGFADPANNGLHKITAVTATDLTCGGSALVDEASAAGRTILARMARNGSTKRSFSVEEEFPDVASFVKYIGMRISQWQMTVTAKQIVTGSFSFMGQKGVSAGATAVSTGNVSGNSNVVFNASNNVGTILEGGAALATALRSIQFSLNNNPREVVQIGSLTPADINYGTCQITGTIEAYFDGLTLYEKFLNHTSSSLSFRLTDSAGNIMIVTIPKVYYMEGDPGVPGVNQDVMVSLPFTAVRDVTTDCVIQVDLLPASI
jgi:hypothetical protein